MKSPPKEWLGLAGELSETGCVPTTWDGTYLRARQKEADALYPAFQQRVRQRGRRLRFWISFIVVVLVLLSWLENG